MRDIHVLVATPAALFIALLFVARRGSGTTSFPTRRSGPPPCSAAPLSTDQRSEFERWWDVQPQVSVPSRTTARRC
jgi:hypothetical protein